MLNLTIITIGKLKEKAIKELADEYLKRLKPFARVEVLELKDESFGDSNMKQAKDKETERILAAIARYPQAHVIALDERGDEYDSPQLASYLEKQTGSIVFIIGGSLGLGDAVKEACHKQLALSRLTFTHEMARLFLFEQLYRCVAITKGKKYHH